MIHMASVWVPFTSESKEAIASYPEIQKEIRLGLQTAGRKLGMYPIETAIVNACHSGQGGTGDVAILTAANRMQLMPFAQIATRIGGAITVTMSLIAMARLS